MDDQSIRDEAEGLDPGAGERRSPFDAEASNGRGGALQERSDEARAALCGGLQATSPTGGLPLVSCAPLTAAERVLLGSLGAAHRSLALAIDEALDRGTVDRGLQVATLAVQAGQAADQVLVTLGRGR